MPSPACCFGHGGVLPRGTALSTEAAAGSFRGGPAPRRGIWRPDRASCEAARGMVPARTVAAREAPAWEMARMADDPVETLITDDPSRPPAEGTGLCLSGGGYRAMVFHLGVLWRLYECGLLKDVRRVSSVSGGSITAATLALAWRRLSFDPARLHEDFVPAVVAPIRSLAGETVDAEAIVLGALLPGRDQRQGGRGVRRAPVQRRDAAGSARRAALRHQRHQRAVGRPVALHEALHARLPGRRGEGAARRAGHGRRRVLGLSAGAFARGDAARPRRPSPRTPARTCSASPSPAAWCSPMAACTTTSGWKRSGSATRRSWSATAAASWRPRRSPRATGHGTPTGCSTWWTTRCAPCASAR